MAPRTAEENRTRATCHLPLRNEREEKAFKSVIAYLQKQRTKRIGVNGYTYSDPNAFFGFWWDSKKRRWIEDKIVLLMIDYKIPLSNPRETLAGKIAELKAQIRKAYERHGSPQDEEWVVTQRITRH